MRFNASRAERLTPGVVFSLIGLVSMLSIIDDFSRLLPALAVAQLPMFYVAITAVCIGFVLPEDEPVETPVEMPGPTRPVYPPLVIFLVTVLGAMALCTQVIYFVHGPSLVAFAVLVAFLLFTARRNEKYMRFALLAQRLPKLSVLVFIGTTLILMSSPAPSDIGPIMAFGLLCAFYALIASTGLGFAMSKAMNTRKTSSPWSEFVLLAVTLNLVFAAAVTVPCIGESGSTVVQTLTSQTNR